MSLPKTPWRAIIFALCLIGLSACGGSSGNQTTVTTGEPTTGEPTTGEPTTGEPTTGEPTTYAVFVFDGIINTTSLRGGYVDWSLGNAEDGQGDLTPGNRDDLEEDEAQLVNLLHGRSVSSQTFVYNDEGKHFLYADLVEGESYLYETYLHNELGERSLKIAGEFTHRENGVHQVRPLLLVLDSIKLPVLQDAFEWHQVTSSLIGERVTSDLTRDYVRLTVGNSYLFENTLLQVHQQVVVDPKMVLRWYLVRDNGLESIHSISDLGFDREEVNSSLEGQKFFGLNVEKPDFYNPDLDREHIWSDYPENGWYRLTLSFEQVYLLKIDTEYAHYFFDQGVGGTWASVSTEKSRATEVFFYYEDKAKLELTVEEINDVSTDNGGLTPN